MLDRLIYILLIITLFTCPVRRLASCCCPCSPAEPVATVSTCCCSKTADNDQAPTPTKPAKPAKAPCEECQCACLCGGAILTTPFVVDTDLKWQFFSVDLLVAKSTADSNFAGCRGPDRPIDRSPANSGRTMRQLHSSFTI